MPRRPIGPAPMTGAERQARYRARFEAMRAACEAMAQAEPTGPNGVLRVDQARRAVALARAALGMPAPDSTGPKAAR